SRARQQPPFKYYWNITTGTGGRANACVQPALRRAHATCQAAAIFEAAFFFAITSSFGLNTPDTLSFISVPALLHAFPSSRTFLAISPLSEIESAVNFRSESISRMEVAARNCRIPT